ncbi:MAG: GDP-mannose 4,6-dehydratase [Nanoarchaeota archaeon]
MRALITGISSQDGSYLAELLSQKGYDIIGLVRPGGPRNTAIIQHLQDQIQLKEVLLTNLEYIKSVIRQLKPDEIYNLAAVSNYNTYINDPIGSHDINGNTPLIFLEAIRKTNPKIRFFQASTCQIYGNPTTRPQNEQTPPSPVTAYGASKSFATTMIRQYREQHNLFATNAILFNHESPRRPIDFVTRKITMTVAKIKLDMEKQLVLGNLDVLRDWGFAGDYVKAMWEINNHTTPNDFIVGTGITHTVREFVEEAFKAAGITSWENYVKQDPTLMRSETAVLQADISKIKSELGWQPTVSFKELVKMMVEHDIEMLKNPQAL